MAGKPLLADVSFEVRRSELHVVLGPSGCGKTTLLKTIAGLHPLRSGQILLDGERLDGRPAHERNVVLLHQEDTLFPHLNVAKNVAFGLRLRKKPTSEIERRVGELLRLVGLSGFADRRVNNLSGGERQRVALARALAVQPNALLLDEPFSALDRALRQGLREDVRSILRDAGIVALFVTHDRDEALGLADELIVLADGTVQQAGKPGDVFLGPSSLAVARVLGRRNLFRFDSAPTLAPPKPGDGPRNAWFLVAEEDVTFHADTEGAGIIENVEFIGSRTVYRIRLGAVTLYAEVPGVPVAKRGDRVAVDWPPAAYRVFDAPGKTPQS